MYILLKMNRWASGLRGPIPPGAADLGTTPRSEARSPRDTVGELPGRPTGQLTFEQII